MLYSNNKYTFIPKRHPVARAGNFKAQADSRHESAGQNFPKRILAQKRPETAHLSAGKSWMVGPYPKGPVFNRDRFERPGDGNLSNRVISNELNSRSDISSANVLNWRGMFDQLTKKVDAITTARPRYYRFPNTELGF
jgi:hypothetical protein